MESSQKRDWQGLGRWSELPCGKAEVEEGLDCWSDRQLGHPREHRFGCLQPDTYVGMQGLKIVIPTLEVRCGGARPCLGPTS